MQQILSSPVRAGGIMGAGLGANGNLHSPSMNRLDRILELVTDHEANYRDQDIKLSEVVQKMAELEMRISPLGEWAPLWALKERNIPQELDLARTAVETVVRQLTAVTKTNQLLQSELKSCQAKQQQQAAAYESAIAVLQSDVAALRNRLDDNQAHTRSAVEQLRASMGLQLERQQQEVEEQMQSIQRESASSINLLRQDLAAKSTTSVRELETWTKGELLGLTAKVKAVLTGCAAHQQQVNLQMEALQQQWDNTTAAMETLQGEDKRIKKHVVRLQNQTEELQRLSQQAVTSEVALQQVRNDIQQLHATQQQLATRLEVTCSSSSSLSHRVAEADQQLATLDSHLAANTADLTRLAESVGSCLAAARADAAAAAAAAPSSYLSTLLAPAGGGGGLGAAPAAAAASARRQPWSAWDDQLADFDDFVGRLRKRLQGNEKQCSRLQQAAAASPVRRAATTGMYQQQQQHYQQQSSPGGASAGMLRRRL